MVVISLAAIAVMVIGMLGTGAWFSDQKTSTLSSITSATLKLDGAGFANVGFDIPNMAPGDVSPEYVIEIKNAGNIDLGWFGNLVIDDSPLKDVIYIKEATMEYKSPSGNSWETLTGLPGGTPLAFDHFISDGVGSGPWPTTWGGPGGLATLASFDGNNTMGTTPYEFMGALKPGYSYVLKLQFGFYELAGNAYQNLGPMNFQLLVDSTQLKSGALEALRTTFSNHLVWMNQRIDLQNVTP